MLGEAQTRMQEPVERLRARRRGKVNVTNPCFCLLGQNGQHFQLELLPILNKGINVRAEIGGI